MKLGATLEGAGNGLFGWFVIKAGKEILGPAPEQWAEDVASDLQSTN